MNETRAWIYEETLGWIYQGVLTIVVGSLLLKLWGFVIEFRKNISNERPPQTGFSVEFYESNLKIVRYLSRLFLPLFLEICFLVFTIFLVWVLNIEKQIINDNIFTLTVGAFLLSILISVLMVDLLGFPRDARQLLFGREIEFLYFRKITYGIFAAFSSTGMSLFVLQCGNDVPPIEFVVGLFLFGILFGAILIFVSIRELSVSLETEAGREEYFNPS